MRKRNSASLVDYRSVLNRRGDITLGAYARAQRRSRILMGLAGVGLMVAAAWVYFMLRPAGEIRGPGTVPVLVRCSAQDCGYEGVVHVRPGADHYPMVCPKCGANSCYKVWRCLNCGHLFVRKADQCPACGSFSIGTAEDVAPEPEPP